ncbi:hypothetical protein ACFE04_001578 [Oxalis oulophora]
MAIELNFIFFFLFITTTTTNVLAGTVIEDLQNLQPPPDFSSTIKTNCLNNPSLRYCNSTSDLDEIFKFTIVASHLCNASKNPNCIETFPKIDLRSRPKLAPLYLSFDFFWKFCPLTVISIDLANNSLTGGFPSDILLCSQIEGLDLSFNRLSGDVPIQSLSALNNLSFLNLSYNQFYETGISESDLFFIRFNSSSFIHSGVLSSNRNYTIKALVLLVGFPILILVMVGLIWWLCFRRPDFLPRFLQRKHKFTPSMLKAATNGFLKKKLVGKFQGIDIYKGKLRNNEEVRIEIYWENVSSQNRNKFVEECKVLVQLRHGNLVRTLGWCNNRRLRAVVTRWTEGENVRMWLEESGPTWKQRLKVMMGVIKGMCYLQEEWPEVEYDLGTSSVLLPAGGDLEPLISRFKIGDESSISKNIYSFGVFVLEMITNKRAEDQNEDEFIEYIRMQYPEKLEEVIDERMKLTEKVAIDQAKKGLGLGLMCTDQATSRLPSLVHIYNMIRRAYDQQFELHHTHRTSHEGDCSSNTNKGHTTTRAVNKSSNMR